MRRFIDDDGGYLDWLAANPESFVINAARNPASAYLVLHRARCRTIGGQPARGDRWTAGYVKYCGERAELEAFARDHLAGDLRSCGLCLRRSAERGQPTTSHADPARAPKQDTGGSGASGQAAGPLPAASATAPAGTAATRAPPVMFARPDSHPAQLPAAPRLASWNRADNPDQARLEAYLAAAEQLLLPRCELLTGPLALRLDIGLPPATPLLDQRDLDNYLYPLAARLSKTIGPRLVSVWGTKQHCRASFARIEPATPITATSSPGHRYTVRTSTSSQSVAFKQQIHDQLTGAATLPDGAVSMQLSFTVGPGRNWLSLWKPAIDSQGRILGDTNPSRPWHPKDGRIVELGLHCQVDHTLGNDVLIAIDATTKQT